MSDRIELGDFDTCKGGEQGCEITLKTPSGSELQGFRIRGYDSASYQEARLEQRRALLERGRQRKVPTPQDLEVIEVELSAVLVIGWPDRFALDGQPFPYSPANAAMLMRRFPWVREQVEEAARERANFLPRSASGS